MLMQDHDILINERGKGTRVSAKGRYVVFPAVVKSHPTTTETEEEQTDTRIHKCPRELNIAEQTSTQLCHKFHSVNNPIK